MSDLHKRVQAIYRRVDAEVSAAGPRCEASGRCCRFAEYGHTLFLSNLEADLLLAEAPGVVGPVSSATCPFQVGHLCTAREPRPLGCRVYFCDPAYQKTAAEISEKYLRELKALAVELNLPWRYAPLHHFLAEAVESWLGDASSPSAALVNTRLALPVVSQE